MTYYTEVMVVFPSSIVASALAPTSVMSLLPRLEKGEEKKKKKRKGKGKEEKGKREKED